jgi:branched-chain amino acid transport system permease protein
MIEYIISIGILICIYSMLAQGLNMILGLGRMLHLGHIGIFAIGAYFTGIMNIHGYGFLFSTSLGVIASCICAIFLSLLTKKLKGDYFAIATLAFHYIVYNVLLNWIEITRGPLGIPGIQRPSLGEYSLENNILFFVCILFITILALSMTFLLFRSHIARKLIALREYEDAALSLGIKDVSTRNIVFLFGSILASLSGSCMAIYLQFIDPSIFYVTTLIFILTLIIVGGIGTFWGVIFSTIGLVVFTEIIRFLPFETLYLGSIQQIIYALILYIFLFLHRERLFPKQREI